MSDFFRSLDRAIEHEDGAYDRFVENVERAIIRQDDTTVTFRLVPDARKALSNARWTDVGFLGDGGVEISWYDRIDERGTE